MPPPPVNNASIRINEYHRKGLTEFTLRKLIQKDMFLALREEIEPKRQSQKEEKRGAISRLQMELSTGSIIPRHKKESSKTLRPSRLPS